jgi:hypothetical protein
MKNAIDFLISIVLGTLLTVFVAVVSDIGADLGLLIPLWFVITMVLLLWAVPAFTRR